MIVADLNLRCIRSCPTETDPPLIIDSDGVLSLSVTFQCLESVNRRDSHILQDVRLIQLDKLPEGHSGDTGIPGAFPGIVQSLSLGILERGDQEACRLGSVGFGEPLLTLLLVGGNGLRFGFGCCRSYIRNCLVIMVTMAAVLVVDMGRASTAGDLDEGQLKFGKDASEDLLLILTQVTAGLLLDDLQVVDEHLGGLEVDLGLAGRRMSHLAQAESCLLGVHHHEFDEALGEIGGVGCLLDFGHNNRGV